MNINVIEVRNTIHALHCLNKVEEDGNQPLHHNWAESNCRVSSGATECFIYALEVRAEGVNVR